jgi:hypothetical protein
LVPKLTNETLKPLEDKSVFPTRTLVAVADNTPERELLIRSLPRERLSEQENVN